MSTLFKIIFAMIGGFFALLIVISTFALGGFSDMIIPLALVIVAIFFILRHSQRKKTERESTVIDLLEKRKAETKNGYERYEGHGAIVELSDHRLIISRHGLGSFLTQGIKGEKRIPFNSLTAVQFKHAQKHMSGFIQFSVKGEVASRRGILDATLDENTVMFTFDQQASFEKLLKKVEGQIETQLLGAAVSSTSYADELTKLADLRDRGVFDEVEFQAHKTRLASVV